MRDFARVSPMFWMRGSGKALRGDMPARFLALYLFTCPSSNMIGLYCLSVPAMAHETGMATPDVMAALARLADVGVAHYDDEAELVWLPAAARWQIGQSLKPRDHQRRGVLRALVPFNGHRFVDEFLRRYGAAYHLDPTVEELGGRPLEDPWKGDESPSQGESVSAPPPLRRGRELATDPLRSPSEGLLARAQDQEQDQEQEHERRASRPAEHTHTPVERAAPAPSQPRTPPWMVGTARDALRGRPGGESAPQGPPGGSAGVAEPDGAVDPKVTRLAALISGLPALAGLNSSKLAALVWGDAIPRGTPVSWLEAAIRDASRDLAAEDAAGHPPSAPARATKVARYCARARRPEAGEAPAATWVRPTTGPYAIVDPPRPRTRQEAEDDRVATVNGCAALRAAIDGVPPPPLEVARDMSKVPEDEAKAS